MYVNVYTANNSHRKCECHTHTMSVSTSDQTLLLHNPVYEGGTSASQTTYRMSRRGVNKPLPHTTPTVSNEEHSTSKENNYTLETGYGEYSMIGQSDPQNNGHDPQEYEVPAPTVVRKYSTEGRV